MKKEKLRKFAGWLPAVILPLAAVDQLMQALAAENLQGVSLSAWALFLIANLGSLVFAPAEPRVARIQVWIAFGLTSCIEVALIGLILMRRASF